MRAITSTALVGVVLALALIGGTALGETTTTTASTPTTASATTTAAGTTTAVTTSAAETTTKNEDPTTAGNFTTTQAPPSTTPTSSPDVKEEVSKALLAGGWIPFVVVMGLAFLYSFTYMKFYQHRKEKEFIAFVVAVLGLSVALITTALIPVDIYLVSHFKGSDSTYHSWATESNRSSILDDVRYGYYAMYGLCVLFSFCLIPLAYFFFEEKDEDAGTTKKQRCFTAFKYTLGILFVMGIIMCIGAFAISSGVPECNSNKDKDVEKQAKCKAEFAKDSLTQDGGNNAIMFTIGFLQIIGTIYFIFYTATGMVAMPIAMIKSRGRSKGDRMSAKEQLAINREKRASIRSRYDGKKKKKMSSRDRDALARTEEEDRVLSRATRQLDQIETGCFAKIKTALRPFEFIFGIILFLVGIFIWVSLLMSAADKLIQINKQHLSYVNGYTQTSPKVINPVDKILTLMQVAFPLDYIFMVLLMYYFVTCTLAGVKYLGVRFCGLKVFSVKAQRTVPQGLLFLCTIVMFTLLYIIVVLMTLAPNYVRFGNQHFPAVKHDETVPDGVANTAVWPSEHKQSCANQPPPILPWVNFTNEAKVLQLDMNGDKFYDKTSFNHCNQTFDPINIKYSEDGVQKSFSMTDPNVRCGQMDPACTATRIAVLVDSFAKTKIPMTLIYYWAEWGFILVYFVSLIWVTCKKRKSLMQSLVNDMKDDFSDSDDDMTPFSPSWAK